MISFIATVGNYEYGFYWHLYLDGTIELDVKLTGIFNTAGLMQDGSTGRGTLVSPGVVGHIHQHVFNVRLDMAVDGPNNTVVEVDTVADPPGPDNPWDNALSVVETPLTDRKGGPPPRRRRAHALVEDRQSGPQDGARAPSRLQARGAQRAAHAGGGAEPGGPRAGFVTNDVWVTPTRADERWPAGDYVNQSEPGQGLPAWTEQDRPVADRPITVWHSFGHHHIVRPEGLSGAAGGAFAGFMLQPFAFFDRNPTLDIPPATSVHSCCA